LGQTLAAQWKLSDAIANFESAVRLQPNNAEANFELANALTFSGESARALEFYRVAWSLRSDVPQKLGELAKILARKANWSGALQCYSNALQLEPQDADIRHQLGFALLQQKRVEEAVVHLTEAAKLKPGAESHYELGIALALAGRSKDAVAQYAEALKLEPELTVALNDLAWVLATDADDQIRNGQEAVRLAEKACELTNWKEARFLGTLDAAYAEAANFEKAATTAQKARDLALAVNQVRIAEAAEERLKLYQKKKPYRQK
jgi:Flp pilus assembly protein TadD